MDRILTLYSTKLRDAELVEPLLRKLSMDHYGRFC
jgi:hypothetical protein